MAIDSKKMETWLGGGAEPSTAPAKKGAAKPAKGKVVDEEEPAAEEEAEGSIEERYPTLFPLLEENGSVVEEALEEVDGDLLSDPETDLADEEETLTALTSAIDALPTEIKDAMAEELKELTHEQALEIAQALEAGEHITDADKMAGFLFHGAAVIAAGAEPAEEEEAEEETDDELEEEAEVPAEE